MCNLYDYCLQTTSHDDQVGQDSVQQEVSGQVAAGEAVEGAQKGAILPVLAATLTRKMKTRQREATNFFNATPPGLPKIPNHGM
jgi:hypothetical protein